MINTFLSSLNNFFSMKMNRHSLSACHVPSIILTLSLTHPGPVKAKIQKKCLAQQFSRKESYFKSLLGTCL